MNVLGLIELMIFGINQSTVVIITVVVYGLTHKSIKVVARLARNVKYSANTAVSVFKKGDSKNKIVHLKSCSNFDSFPHWIGACYYSNTLRKSELSKNR